MKRKDLGLLVLILVIGTVVWATPHTMIADRAELAAMGRAFNDKIMFTAGKGE